MIIEFISSKESYTINWPADSFWYVRNVWNKQVYLHMQYSCSSYSGTIEVSSDEEGAFIVSALTKAMVNHYQSHVSYITINSLTHSLTVDGKLIDVIH